MACCSGRKKQMNLMPPELMEIKKNAKFSNYSDDDLFGYYYEFRQITQSSNNLDKKQFHELIRAFNVD